MRFKSDSQNKQKTFRTKSKSLSQGRQKTFKTKSKSLSQGKQKTFKTKSKSLSQGKQKTFKTKSRSHSQGRQKTFNTKSKSPSQGRQEPLRKNNKRRPKTNLTNERKKLRKQKYQNTEKYYVDLQKHRKKYDKYKQEQCQQLESLDRDKLVNQRLVEEAIRGLRNLGSEKNKNVLDADTEDFIQMDVTLCKLPTPAKDAVLGKPMFVEVLLPNTLANERTDVLLIVDDEPRDLGAVAPPEWTTLYYKELLQKKNVAHLITEIMPLLQLRTEYLSYEAKRSLSSRADVVLVHHKAFSHARMGKLLGKSFYGKRKIPITVCLKRKNAAQEIRRALRVSHLCYNGGTCSSMKVGRLSQTDEELKENILAAVKGVAGRVPGKWFNVQNIILKLQKSIAIPIYVNLAPLNEVKTVLQKPKLENSVVIGPVNTIEDKTVKIYADGSVFIAGKRKRTEEGMEGETPKQRKRTKTNTITRKTKKNKKYDTAPKKTKKNKKYDIAPKKTKKSKKIYTAPKKTKKSKKFGTAPKKTEKGKKFDTAPKKTEKGKKFGTAPKKIKIKAKVSKVQVKNKK